MGSLAKYILEDVRLTEVVIRGLDTMVQVRILSRTCHDDRAIGQHDLVRNNVLADPAMLVGQV